MTRHTRPVSALRPLAAGLDDVEQFIAIVRSFLELVRQVAELFGIRPKEGG